jgi:phosphoribosylglycinamide formyltransferase-1
MRIVVLISGSGSNLQSLIDSCEKQSINGDVVAVVSNKADVFGLSRAKEAGIPALVLSPQPGQTREAYDEQLRDLIDQYSPDLVVLAGFMRILSAGFVTHYAGRMLNIHPSLLPKYKGLHTHQRAIDNGDDEHGVSVHFVTAELDGGPVVLQAKVPIFADDDADELARRVQQQEHQIYPLVVAWFASGRLVMQDGLAYLDNKRLPSDGYAAE